MPRVRSLMSQRKTKGKAERLQLAAGVSQSDCGQSKESEDSGRK